MNKKRCGILYKIITIIKGKAVVLNTVTNRIYIVNQREIRGGKRNG